MLIITALTGTGVIAVMRAGGTSNHALLTDASFTQPIKVKISGYDGHAMEPFLTRDGQYLLFNNRNDPPDQTDLHIARRIHDLRFKYLHPLAEINSGALDGVASVDRHGRIYFISNRDYDVSGNTLWTGDLHTAQPINPHPLKTDFTPKKLLRLNIDMEITADGDTLYVAENRWNLLAHVPATSDIAIARRDGGIFRRLPDSNFRMQHINSRALEFAPATSADELTLYFTRLDMNRFRRQPEDAFMIMISQRKSRSAQWEPPKRVGAIRGHVEAPTISPDGCALYFHRKDKEQFALYITRRLNCP